MNDLTTKQKIIIGGIIGIMLVTIGIYGYNVIRGEEEQDILLADKDIQNEVFNQEDTETKKEEMLKDMGQIGDFDKQTSNKNLIVEENTKEYKNLEGKMIIHITGAVQKTGILVLEEGARIADAIDMAGGSTEDADLDEVNLAYVLQDGQKIYIPSKGDKEKLERKAYITSGSGNNDIIQIDSQNEKGGNKKVNINTATKNELENLPGIGEAIAGRIIEYREQNGKFDKIEDLQNVKGIGDAKLNDMKEYVMIQ